MIFLKLYNVLKYYHPIGKWEALIDKLIVWEIKWLRRDKFIGIFVDDIDC